MCPKSLISAESEAWIHLFSNYKALHYSPRPDYLDARTADALIILENEWRKEIANASREP